MGIEEIYARFKESFKVVKDTRENVRDCMYFSLKGESFNGNKYAKEALDNGARYAVIDEKKYLVDDRMILVDDVLKCLQDLARYHRNQLKIPILALTGSNGKTTTKELIHAVLKRKFNCLATKGNLNNHIGVPLTLLGLTSEHELGVVEMGANHQLEIDELCKIALPDYGYITNFGRVHLEGFGSFEGVIQGKTEMYRHLASHRKTVFVNSEDHIQMEKTEGMNRILFGSEHNVDFKTRFIDADPFVRMEFDQVEIQSQLIGNYNYANIAVAVAIGSYFGIETEEIKKGVEAYVPQNNRSQIIDIKSNRIILDAYNANPNSMEVAIDNLSKLSADQKIAILGDMFELGNDSSLEHERIASLASESGVDQVFLIGENFSKTKLSKDCLIKFSSFEEFKDQFLGLNIENSTILIKASRGMALERTLDLL
ncbi:UDP-N-acetylmuramoyl-tripeptide--D-alanyl-D-alanine ligase [Lutimonas zeaxanthinifaciens]|uniref:UDP-N-acetylmuramoyl-tripeptide--D-alanyl-D- alanine ligase n=1 Tax=Lutimonas zeaxanthinifaciens TaxID=3060215 RepID=UPI00265C99F1|nr:UDP-N-acetylmuramoyl-tripeptide--D-alanyl-D-alanine ligase [Lutimonas sp. YSD2104]WKK66868.1 UDP-N-acetylmuramoyl-tripeptide--D-alanyl-D-alanine ligase [Lutimonas sp. YSD2104]